MNGGCPGLEVLAAKRRRGVTGVGTAGRQPEHVCSGRERTQGRDPAEAKVWGESHRGRRHARWKERAGRAAWAQETVRRREKGLGAQEGDGQRGRAWREEQEGSGLRQRGSSHRVLVLRVFTAL